MRIILALFDAPPIWLNWHPGCFFLRDRVSGGEGPTPVKHDIAFRVLRAAPRRGSLGAFLIAAALLAVGLVIRIPLDALAGAPLPPYITAYPLLPFIGFFSGFRAGLGAVIAALAFAWFFLIYPIFSLAVPDLRTGLMLVIFLFAGPVAVGFGALARRALEDVAELNTAANRNAREAVHRTKNIITAVKAVARGEARRAEDSKVFLTRFNDMLDAMSRAQDVLVSSGGEVRTVAKLAEAGVASCLANPQLRITGGPDIRVPEGDFSGLVLALHELCTNSLKYGALGSDDGRVDLSWRLDDRCVVSWEEKAQAVQEGPDGFGSTIIRGALAKVDGGNVGYYREPGRVRCEFSWPASAVSPQKVSAAESAAPGALPQGD